MKNTQVGLWVIIFSEKRLILGLEKFKKCGSEGAIFGANYNSIEMLKDSFCLLKD